MTKLEQKKTQTILTFLKDNMVNEKDVVTSNLEHDLVMINSKELTIDKQLKQYNKDISKEQKQYDKFFKIFSKQKKYFEKVATNYQVLADFYAEQKEIKDKYDKIHNLSKLTHDDKLIKNKYLRNKEDIDYILSYGDQYISNLNKEISKKNILLDKSKTYKEEYDKLLYTNYKEDLAVWDTKYKDIYTHIINIDKDIGNIHKSFEKLKVQFDRLKKELNTIYISIKDVQGGDSLEPINKILKQIDDNFKMLIHIKHMVKTIKLALIQENEISDIINITSYSEAAFIVMETELNKFKLHLLIDREQILDSNDIQKGGSINISDIIPNYGKLSDFINARYTDIIEMITTINNELKHNSQLSSIYNIKSSDFLNIISIYFNIYLFFLYYNNNRNDSTITEHPRASTINTINLDETDKHILTWFIKIIDFYTTIFTKDSTNRNSTFHDLDIIYQKKIKIYTNESNIHKLEHFFTSIAIKLNAYYETTIKTDQQTHYLYGESPKDTIKDLYYEYNTYNDGIFNDFHAFVGYNKTDNNAYFSDANINNYKDNYKITSNDIFSDNNKHLHTNSKFNNNYIIYSDDTNNNYQFYSVFYNPNINNIHIKKMSKFNEVRQKYQHLLNFLKTRMRAIGGTSITDADITNILNETNANINDVTQTFCSTESNNNINNELSKFIDAQNVLIRDENVRRNALQPPQPQIQLHIFPHLPDPELANFKSTMVTKEWNVGSGFKTKNLNFFFPSNNVYNYTFNDIFCGSGNEYAVNCQNRIHGRTFFYNIFHHLLLSIYNNIAYDETTSCTPNIINEELKFIKTLTNTTHIILYQLTNFGDLDKDTKNRLIKYIYMWLKCENANNNSNILTKDIFSDYIKVLADAQQDTSLLSIDLKSIKDSIFISSNKNVLGSFEKQFNELYKEYKADIDSQIISVSKISTDQNIYFDNNAPIPKRTEERYLFDNKKGYKDNVYTDNNKSIFINNKIDIPIKTPDKLENSHRIVSFNVNRWCTIDTNPIDNIYTNPEYSIDFISNYIPSINVVCFLDYTLHNMDKSNTFIESFSHKYKGGGISENFFTYNNDLNQIQYGGNDDADLYNIDVDNTGIQTSIENRSLNTLTKYSINNDNWNNQIVSDNIFLGKALYYNPYNTTSNSGIQTTNISETLTITTSTNNTENILYQIYTINKDTIGLYFINFKHNKDKLGQKGTESIEKNRLLINKVITHSLNKKNKECIILGNFDNDIKTNHDDFKIFNDKKFKNIGNNTSTYITGATYDLCFVSPEFEKKYKILNENNIVIQSGGVSNHYPIYVDIIKKEDISEITTITPQTQTLQALQASPTYSIIDDKKDLEDAKNKDIKPLLSSFIDKIKKQNINIDIKQNKTSMVQSITNIINIINNELQPKKYNMITKNINIIAQNHIELKLLEKKLKPVSIKDYTKISTEFSWINDVVKTEKEKISVQNTVKELSILIKEHPQIKKLISSSSISENEIMKLLLIINNKDKVSLDKLRTEDDLKIIVNKLSDDTNADKIIEYINKNYDQSLSCTIIITLLQYVSKATKYQKYIADNTCNEKVKKHKDNKDKKQAQKYAQRYTT